MATPNMVLPTAKPLNAYIPRPNSHSSDRALPIREMPQSPEAGYQLLSDKENAFPKLESDAGESRPTPKTWSSDGHDQARVGTERSGWSGWRIGPLPNPLSRSDSTEPRETHQEEYDKVKYEKAEDYYPGIPQLAAVLNIEESFGVYQSFFPQANRILLRRMIKLNKLAKKQRELDAEDVPKRKLHTIETRAIDDNARMELEQDLEKEINEYYDFLLKYVSVKALARPSERTHRHLHNWIIENRPLVKGEDDFIYHINDHVSPIKKNEYSSQHGSLMDSLIDRFLAGKRGSALYSFLTGKDQSVKKGLFEFKDGRYATIRMILSAAVSVSLLLSPVFILFLVGMPRVAMVSTVFGFVIAFSIVLSLVTEGRLQDLLIGTAAYGAFLATFLGNMNQSFAPTA